MRPAALVPSLAGPRWIRFHLMLGFGSMRWLPPFLVLALWSGLAVLSPGPGFAAAAALFPAAAIWAAWTTIAIGSVDDDPHYDLLAAAAGSAARLHRARAATVAVAGAVWAVAVAVLIAPLASACTEAQRRSPSALQCDQPRAVVPLVAVTVLSAGVWAGIGIGTLLHRPIVRDRAVTLGAALGLLAGMMLAPPMQDVLLALDRGHRAPALALQAAAAAWCVGAVAVASRLAVHRAR